MLVTLYSIKNFKAQSLSLRYAFEHGNNGGKQRNLAIRTMGPFIPGVAQPILNCWGSVRTQVWKSVVWEWWGNRSNGIQGISMEGRALEGKRGKAHQAYSFMDNHIGCPTIYGSSSLRRDTQLREGFPRARNQCRSNEWEHE